MAVPGAPSRLPSPSVKTVGGHLEPPPGTREHRGWAYPFLQHQGAASRVSLPFNQIHTCAKVGDTLVKGRGPSTRAVGWPGGPELL